MKKKVGIRAHIAKEVKKLLKLARVDNPDVKLGHCYNDYAKSKGYNSWNHMSAAIARLDMEDN